MEYKGFLVSTDNYMNLQVKQNPSHDQRDPTTLMLTYSFFPLSQLANTEEFQDGKSNGMLGEVFIRCNNVLYLKEIKDE
jgi:small nuclear ribonucleoprotein F